ncbi:MAG: hypothetical protein R3E64_05135 [Halioglobus sp.]
MHRIIAAVGLLLALASVVMPPRASASVMITDTIIADGRVWAQPDLFLQAPGVPNWYAIDAVCPAGVCAGDWQINGATYDMEGWTWAAVEDVNSLFNYYLGANTFGSDPQQLQGQLIAAVFFADGWRATHFTNSSILLSALTRTSSDRFPDFAHEGSVSHIPSGIGVDTWATSPYSRKNGVWSPGNLLSYGGWFYRSAEVPLPSSLTLFISALLLFQRERGPRKFKSGCQTLR